MMLSGAILTAALALVAAQGAHPSARRKAHKPAPAVRAPRSRRVRRRRSLRTWRVVSVTAQ